MIVSVEAQYVDGTHHTNSHLLRTASHLAKQTPATSLAVFGIVFPYCDMISLLCRLRQVSYEFRWSLLRPAAATMRLGYRRVASTPYVMHSNRAVLETLPLVTVCWHKNVNYASVRFSHSRNVLSAASMVYAMHVSIHKNVKQNPGGVSLKISFNSRTVVFFSPFGRWLISGASAPMFSSGF